MFKRVLIIVAIFVISGFILIVGILQSPFLMQPVLKFVLQKALKDYTVQELTIGRQQWIFPGEMRMSDLQVKVTSREGDWSIKSAQVRAQGIHRLILAKASINFSVQGGDVTGKQVTSEGIDLTGDLQLQNYSLAYWRTDVKLQRMEAAKYIATQVSARIEGKQEDIYMNNILANFYQGQIKARVGLQLTKPARYQVDAQLTGVNLDELRDSNKALYEQIQGIMDADIAVKGRGSSLHEVRLRINMTKDAQIRASLLQFVLPYIPPTQDIKVFEELIRRDLKVPVERADMSLESVESQKLSGEIHLGVRKINLNLNLPLDILFDGNLISLIRWYQKLVQ